MTLTVVILTLNEGKHIARALESVRSIADKCVIVDCGSTDLTTTIARNLGADVLSNPWVNYATQFNWALNQLSSNSEWILRLDADEFVEASLAEEIAECLPKLGANIYGAYVPRSVTFLRRPIRHGGLFPIRVLRLFRHGYGRCENRWMDEHIMVEGATIELKGAIIDDNFNSITWWTNKYNSYASREVVDILNLEYRFMPFETIANIRGGQQASVKRWLKENIYAYLPARKRAFLYFFYRYFLMLGILDGVEGTAFHVLQGFWYRYLVDMKLFEVKKYMVTENVDSVTAIREVLGIDMEL